MTVYLPFTAAQVPRLTGPVVAPASITPVYEPVSVLTVAPLVASIRVTVMPWAPAAEACVPWFLMATVNVTVLPADGLLGDQLDGDGDQVGRLAPAQR